MNFNLPALDGTATPAFATAADCRHWLGDQTLTNSAFVQRQLCEQIEMLNRQAIALRERFGILEALQAQVDFVQEEVSKRYAARPLPYLAQEEEAFVATMALWDAMAVGYLRCLEDADTGAGSEQTLSMLVERALSMLHAAQLDRLRGSTQPDASHWMRLHALLAFAERRGIVTTPVSHKTRYGTQAVTPLSVYAESILLSAAGAHEFPARPLSWVVRWARRWSGKLILRAEPPADLQALPLNVDLTSALPPSSVPNRDAGQARYLDTTELAASIKKRLAGLAEGRAPAELQLGDDCAPKAAEQMLQRLHQRWCRGGMPRPTAPAKANDSIELSVGVEAIWFQIAGKPFSQPVVADAAELRRQREELATFGRVSERRASPAPVDSGKLRSETDWQLVGENQNALQLMRAINPDSLRVGVGQLIAVRRPGAAGFTLASVRWLMLDAENMLHAGMLLMPGAVTPVIARNAGINATKDPWRPAFVLVMEQGATQLVLPAGSFRAERVIDVEGGPAKQYKLAQLLERGDDFERVAVA